MMSKLFRSNSTFSLASRSTSLPEIPQEFGIIHNEEYELSDVDLKLGDWNLPKVPTKEFYKSSRNLKALKTDYHVRTIEQVYGINKEYETCYLFSPAQIKAHIKKGHHFLHIGLVQVGVKALIRPGLNNSILLALRDTRHLRFKDSLLGTIQTSLSNGPVHFNCFPNFTLHLHDPHIMKALTLNIKTHGTLTMQGASQISLIYRVYYKSIKTNLNVGALDKKKMGETLLIQTNVQAKIQIPRTLKWDDIDFPPNWTLENENYPLQIQTPDLNLDLDFVQQLVDAKQDSVVDQDDDNSQKVGSPLGTDMEDPYQDDGIKDYDLMILKKDFKADMDLLGKEFDLEKNLAKKTAYRQPHQGTKA
ncbi:hypothetical protein SO802_004353 [Lithocarpus litseifolius]|uniref:Uncharacterized protein n=1 Tax=Lithocarpus litseifolius TaxID=425828 RepID=A0AAW2E4G2_9ROSI